MYRYKPVVDNIFVYLIVFCGIPSSKMSYFAGLPVYNVRFRGIACLYSKDIASCGRSL